MCMCDSRHTNGRSHKKNTNVHIRNNIGNVSVLKNYAFSSNRWECLFAYVPNALLLSLTRFWKFEFSLGALSKTSLNNDVCYHRCSYGNNYFSCCCARIGLKRTEIFPECNISNRKKLWDDFVFKFLHFDVERTYCSLTYHYYSSFLPL